MTEEQREFKAYVEYLTFHVVQEETLKGRRN